jgi:membrane fusion protein (multidrug efflux system)
MSKNAKKLTIYMFSIAIVLILIIPKLKLLKGGDSKDMNKSNKDFRISVKVEIIKQEKLDDKIITTGTVIANEEVEIRSEISGKISQILFKEGSSVKKGDLLIKINDLELQAQLLRAEYKKKLAEDKEYRQKMQLKMESISQQEYDVTLNELNTIIAEIKLIKAQIEKTEIKAPFDGIIGLKYVSEGSYISPSTQIANLQNLDVIKIDFSIPEKYFNNVNKGDEIVFRVQGIDKKYRGTVYAIEPKIDPITRTLNLRAICSNRDSKILSGAFANVELILKEIDNAIMIPTEALVPELKGQKVFLYKNGKAQPKIVETGIRTDKKIQIISGLQEGDTLITSGILQIRPGAQIKISNF